MNHQDEEDEQMQGLPDLGVDHHGQDFGQSQGDEVKDGEGNRITGRAYRAGQLLPPA
jgi:hypothetical protein